MEDRDFSMLKHLTFGILILLLLFSFALSIIVHLSANFDPDSLLGFAARYHISIMLISNIIAVAFGFAWGNIAVRQIRKQEKETKKVKDIIMMFMSNEEKEIIKFLSENDGKARQSDCSKLPRMNRVKAHRCLQKLRDKSVVQIEAHGKVRHIRMNEDIYRILK